MVPTAPEAETFVPQRSIGTYGGRRKVVDKRGVAQPRSTSALGKKRNRRRQWK
jgi:hypothetical protein